MSKKKLRMDDLVKMNVEIIKNDSEAIKRIEEKIDLKYNFKTVGKTRG